MRGKLQRNRMGLHDYSMAFRRKCQNEFWYIEQTLYDMENDWHSMWFSMEMDEVADNSWNENEEEWIQSVNSRELFSSPNVTCAFHKRGTYTHTVHFCANHFQYFIISVRYDQENAIIMLCVFAFSNNLCAIVPLKPIRFSTREFSKFSNKIALICSISSILSFSLFLSVSSFHSFSESFSICLLFVFHSRISQISQSNLTTLVLFLSFVTFVKHKKTKQKLLLLFLFSLFFRLVLLILMWLSLSPLF